MRMFVAIPVQGQPAQQLQRWTGRLQGIIAMRKWVHPQDYHITLQFLGELRPELLPKLRQALRAVVMPRLELALDGADTFGLPHAPRVLWSRITGDAAGLSTLQASIVQATRPLGFMPEERPYKPHITLARGWRGEAAFDRELLASAPTLEVWEASSFSLMCTHMNASPMYECIERYGG
ncbi:RNA 2',3'-cyclic phosphodiesterase [Paenibacillus sp. SYP-B4298]|uniref:RNA 2',3'-cyclic phosphodiesterase n=1 Tax=Paenibacillus sp. SYP-B4298 TaxID=2996034 RepID=UPI0022DE54B4|nr:RNA 2',3'-cyclic phosphodiesterase [Paenibacillus sp. SYP-B4298]